jgi:hypothetical protein
MADLQSTRQSVQSPAPFSTWLGVILLLVIFGVIVLAVIGPSRRGDTYEQMRAKNRMGKLKALRKENAQMLTTYGWVDKNKGVVRIPIDRAMQLTIAKLAGETPQAAYPIATPEPSATPAASPSATAKSGQPPAASASPKPAPSQAPVSPSPTASSVAPERTP